MVDVVRELPIPSVLMLFTDRPPEGLVFKYGAGPVFRGGTRQSGWYRGGVFVASYFSTSAGAQQLFTVYLYDRTCLGLVRDWAERAERLTRASITIVEVATKAEYEDTMSRNDF